MTNGIVTYSTEHHYGTLNYRTINSKRFVAENKYGYITRRIGEFFDGNETLRFYHTQDSNCNYVL